MKKFIPVFFIFAFVLSVSLVFAEGSEGTHSDSGENHGPKPQTFGGMRPDFTKNTTDFRLRPSGNFQGSRSGEMKEKDGTRSADFKRKAQEEIKMSFGKIGTHLVAYLERLDKIAAKIQTRIDKLKGEGKDTTAAEAKLADARALGTTAKTAIDKAKTDATAAVGSTTPRDTISPIRASVEAAKKALIAYQKGLIDVVRLLMSLNGHKEGTHSADI